MKASNSSQSTCIAALRSRRSEGSGNGQPRNLKGLHARPSQQRRAAPDRCLVASLQLPLRRHDLSARRPAAQGAAEARAREASPARPLGREPGAVLRVGASQSRHQAGCTGHDIHGGPGSRRARCAGPCLSRRDVLRDLLGQERRRRRDAEVLQAVLVSGPHRLARDAGDAGIHPRRRRARLQPRARLWRRARQSRTHRGLRGGRRRSGDRAVGHRLAFEQVHQPGSRRGGAADPQPQRLQDREPDGARAHQSRGARVADGRLRLQALVRRGIGSRHDAPEDGRDARCDRRRDPRHLEEGSRQREC